MKRKAKTFSVVFFVSLFLLATTASVFLYLLHKQSQYISNKSFILDPVDDDNFARLLVDRKISKHFWLARLYIKIMKIFKYKAKFGEYAFPHGVSIFEAIKIVDSGNVVIHKITVYEGFSVIQMIRKLEKNEDLLGKIEKMPDEGSLMPDTYFFKYPTKKQDIISMAQQAMRKFIKQEWPKRSSKCTLKSPQEALILASIVEKETRIEKEMVTGVYFRRLHIGMKLQACPTVIYALKRGDVLGRPLKYADLKVDDPYNTYKYEGLPPTPITNPGKASIIAVLHPEETENLFFVAAGKGKHIYSKTYEEHKLNIAKIRQIDGSMVK